MRLQEEGHSFWARLPRLQYFHDHILSPNVGCALILLSQFFNSIMVTTCKLLVTDKDFNTPIHPLQILFVRMIITFMCCVAYMYITKLVEHYPFGPKEVRVLLVCRGIVGFIGVFGMYFLLQYLSLSDAVAFTFLVPMVTAFIAWVILQEPYTILEGICGFFSLGGVLLIAKPHFLFGAASDGETAGDDNIESSSTEKRILASIVGLIGVFGASGVYVILRKIGKRAHPLLSVSYFALTCCVILFISLLVIPSLSFAIPKNRYQWMLFLLIGFSGFIMQFLLTAGIQREKAGRGSLMTYFNMVFALFWDLLIWGHLPGLLSWLGIFIIIGFASIVLMNKPKDNKPAPVDTENGEYKHLETQELGTDDIALQDFIITDDEEETTSEMRK